MQPQHLQSGRMAAYASEYHDHHSKLLQIDDFLKPEIVNSCSHFLLEEAAYENVYGLYGKESHSVSREYWLEAPDNERFFHYQMLDKTNNPKLTNRHVLAFLKLRHFLSSIEFQVYIEQLVQLPLGTVTPVNIHRMQTKQFLRRHDDRQNNRRLAFILYLAPSWHRDNGGLFHFLGLNDEQIIIEPTYNRLLIFDVSHHRHHFISEIKASEAAPAPVRLSINGWFHDKE